MQEFFAPDWQDYRMDYRDPFRDLEPLAQEAAVVQEALDALAAAGILPSAAYDQQLFLRHRQAVREAFEIPWTAISPRVERLIYAINAIARPRTIAAAGIFCGFTFICNAGAAVGPGKCYEAEDVVGIEIKPDEADRARRNVLRLDPTGAARVVAADAVEYLARYDRPVGLLYLDADGDRGRGKSIYLEILQATYDKMPAGALVLAHNSVNAAHQLEDFFAFVGDPANMTAAMNVVLDPEGLLVARK